MQHRGVVKTTPLPTRDSDLHVKYLRRQKYVDRAENSSTCVLGEPMLLPVASTVLS
jgi:hypothetical protein